MNISSTLTMTLPHSCSIYFQISIILKTQNFNVNSEKTPLSCNISAYFWSSSQIFHLGSFICSIKFFVVKTASRATRFAMLRASALSHLTEMERKAQRHTNGGQAVFETSEKMWNQRCRNFAVFDADRSLREEKIRLALSLLWAWIDMADHTGSYLSRVPQWNEGWEKERVQKKSETSKNDS